MSEKRIVTVLSAGLTALVIMIAVLSPMEASADVRHYNFSGETGYYEDETVPDSSLNMRMEKTLPDNYFHMGNTITATSGIYNVRSINLRKDGAKGNTGCFYSKAFKYDGNWIDVRTTYIDWETRESGLATFYGGFSTTMVTGVKWMKMQHEFFLSGTDTPVQVKGFIGYNKVEKAFSVCAAEDDVDDVWIDRNRNLLECLRIPGEKNMLCVRQREDAQTGERQIGFVRFTFSGSSVVTCFYNSNENITQVMTGAAQWQNPDLMVPESISINESISDNDEEKVKENTVDSKESWRYNITVNVPDIKRMKSPYNRFEITDELSPYLKTENITVLCDGEPTEEFTVSCENGCVSVLADNAESDTFYGHEYSVEITVNALGAKERMKQEGMIDKNRQGIITDSAVVTGNRGEETESVEAGQVTTRIQFPLEADIVVTREMNLADIYEPHGQTCFIYKLEGKTSEGEKKAYNVIMTVSGDYAAVNTDSDGKIRKSVTFRDVPEGTYVCYELPTLRFESKVKQVEFVVDSEETREAVFSGKKCNWSNYSHSESAICRIGKGLQ